MRKDRWFILYYAMALSSCHLKQASCVPFDFCLKNGRQIFLSLLGLLVVLHSTSIPCTVLYRSVHSTVSIRFLIVILCCAQEARFRRLFGLIVVISSEFFFFLILLLLTLNFCAFQSRAFGQLSCGNVLAEELFLIFTTRIDGGIFLARLLLKVAPGRLYQLGLLTAQGIASHHRLLLADSIGCSGHLVI